MSISLTLPGFELSLSRNVAYLRVSKLFEAVVTPTDSGGPLWEVSRFEVGTGFQLVAGPLALDIGKP